MDDIEDTVSCNMDGCSNVAKHSHFSIGRNGMEFAGQTCDHHYNLFIDEVRSKMCGR